MYKLVGEELRVMLNISILYFNICFEQACASDKIPRDPKLSLTSSLPGQKGLFFGGSLCGPPLPSPFCEYSACLVFDFLPFLPVGSRGPEHSVLRKQNRGLGVAQVHLAFLMVL